MPQLANGNHVYALPTKMCLSLSFPLKLTKMPHYGYNKATLAYVKNRYGVGPRPTPRYRAFEKKHGFRNQAWKAKKSIRRPKGTVTSGLLQSRNRYQNSSLLLGTIPKVGTKDLKYYDTFSSSGSSTIEELGQSQSVHTLQVISAVGAAPNFDKAVKQGNTVHTRIGQKIFLKRLVLKGYIGYPYIDSLDVTANPGGTMQGRLIIVLDKQPNQTTADIDEVLAGDDTQSMSMRMINYANTKRFKILKDESFTIQPQRYAGTTVFGESVHKVDCEIDLTGITVSYVEGPDGLAGDIITNNIYAFYGTDHFHPENLDNTYANLKSVQHFHARVYFTG